MPAFSLNCPNCGAPLRIEEGQTLTLCAYCDSSIRLELGPNAATNAQMDADIPAAVIQQVKQLLLEGKRAEAVKRYELASGADHQAVERALVDFEREISASIVLGQPLNPLGIGLLVLGELGTLTAVVLGMLELVPWLWLAFVIAGINVLLLPFYLAVPRTMRYYLQCRSAPATMLRATRIGQMGSGATPIHIFRLLLEVRPDNQAPFQTQVNWPVREAKVEQIRPGKMVQVRYNPNHLGQVYFERELN